jgi:hypothetical protein
MNEIEIFGNFSALMINRNKTEGLWILIRRAMISTYNTNSKADKGQLDVFRASF